jgi:hypothetical protein
MWKDVQGSETLHAYAKKYFGSSGREGDLPPGYKPW